MKILKQLLFTAALMVGFSTIASAQKEGDKNPPPKKDPPVVVVEPKKPKEEKPKEEKKKPPQAYVFIVKEERISE